MRAARKALFAIVLGAGLAAAVPAIAEPVTVQAATRADMGRIVFVWNAPVSFESQVSGRSVTLTFGRPIEASYDRVTRSLAKYISAAAPGADGHSVTFTLKGDVDVYSFDSGSSIIVEIVDKAPAAKADKAEQAPEAKPAASAAAPAQPAAKPTPTASGGAGKDLPTVRVRAGQHPDYTRLVFDWPTAVPYKVDQQGGIATITFKQPADIDLKTVQTQPFIGGARARVGADDVTVTLSVPASSRLKHFLSGSKVVIDVGRPTGSDKAGPLPPETETAAAAAPAPKADAAATKAEAKPTPAAPATAAVSPPAAAPAEATAAGAAARAKTSALAAGEQAPAQPQPATQPRPQAQLGTQPGGQPGEQPGAGQPVRLTPRAAGGAALSPTAPPPGQPAQAPTGASPGASGAASPGTSPVLTPGAPTALTPGASPIAQAPQLPRATPAPTAPKVPLGEAVTLRFDWTEPVGAAVFRRAGTLWVAFDKAQAIDLGKLRQTAGNLIHGIEQMGTADGTVLRISTVSGVNPSVRRDGLAWLLDFRKQPLEPATPLTVTAQPDSPVGARLFLPVPEPASPIGIIDPEVGDNLVIVPVIPLGSGIAFEYVYPQLNLLQTAQGVVIQPKADDLRVRPVREGIEVTSLSDLRISAVSADAAARAKLGAMKPLTRILKLEPWEIKTPAAFVPRRQALLAAITGSKDEKRQQARLDLARFYFTNGYNVEALDALAQAARDKAEIETDPEFHMLRGGARMMMGRLEQAAGDFGHPSVKDNDEAIFWTAALRATAGDLDGAAADLKRTGPVIRPYPRVLKAPLGSLITETAIAAGDTKQAKHFLEIMRLGDLSPVEKAQVDYEEGRLLADEGENDEAIAKWESVIAGPHRPSSAKARLARAELLLKLGRINKLQAIGELEKLRFSWRGDEFEFNLLRRLGQLYLDEKLYRQGLTALRQAATYFRTHPDAPQVTQTMSDVFSKLYLENAADAIPPVTALAIYEEFKELTPAGPRGDEMIRRLADRLVGVDLLDKAAELLNAQVKFRLQGVEKVQVGTQLSLIHVLAQEYDAAMQVLNDTELPNIPEPLATQRRHLRSKILIDKKQGPAALNVLGDDASRDAELLRFEVFWTAGDWNNVGQTMRRLLRITNAKPGLPLNMDQASYVLAYSTALTLGGNERALGQIRADYGAAMATTPLKDAFKLISTPTPITLIRREDVAGIVKQVEQFKTFLTDYRAKLKKINLSELVPAKGPLAAVTPEAWQKPVTLPQAAAPGAKPADAKQAATPAAPAGAPTQGAPPTATPAAPTASKQGTQPTAKPAAKAAANKPGA